MPCSLSVSDLQNIYALPFPLKIKDQLLLIYNDLSSFCWCTHGICGVTWWNFGMQTSPLKHTGKRIPKWKQRFFFNYYYFRLVLVLRCSGEPNTSILTSSSIFQRGKVMPDAHIWKCMVWFGVQVSWSWFPWWTAKADLDHPLKLSYTTFYLNSAVRYRHLWKVLCLYRPWSWPV